MTRIDPSSLHAMVRAQLDPSNRDLVAGSPRKKDSIDIPKTSSPEQQMLRRLKAIASDDPQRQKKALRIFMESVLAKEFGTKLQTDPGFPQLVEQVIEQMQEDPALNAACSTAADLLLKQTD